MTKKTEILEHRSAILADYASIEKRDYHDYRTETEPRWYVPLASYGDYDNSCQIERANAQYLQEEFDCFSQQTGGYGGVSTYISKDDLVDMEDDTFDRVTDMLGGLCDCPCLNDDLLSQCEYEAETEAWGNWLKADIISDLRKALPEENQDSFDAWLDNHNDPLCGYVLASMEATNTYFEHEAGGNVYLDIKRIMPALVTSIAEAIKS